MRRDEVRDLKAATLLRTSHSKVVDQMGHAIVSGAYAVGETLPGDSELEERFDVSRSVLREAMKTLTAKGLVVAKSRVGTRVTEKCHWNLLDEDVLHWHFRAGVSAEFLNHLYDVRLVLEPAAAALAATNASAEDCGELRHYANALGASNLSYRQQVEADLKFHVLMFIVSANPFMESMIGFIKTSLDGAFTLAYSQHGNHPRDGIALSHLAIVDAIERKDSTGACDAMRHVIELGRQSAIAALSRPSAQG
ncbi:FadR/GntR family transcriptional regulator [Rhizobium sp. AG855]|uniref:FadR/GntR family transcriptional regulator n=1 Tax=Rhizobium sp. AG855 TaxID=2183898 RepID=UPI000E72A4E7|nr:FadR/GntR family transcriptional regulator [Rhizobium sp. AG855]RKE84761.1 GntR family transcriptional regulator [Rhizobium sp. AG855]